MNAPAAKERKRRVGMHRARTVRDWMIVLASGLVIAFAMATVVLVVASLSGCTTLTYEQQQALALQAKGCFCAARECEAVTSASGQAALNAAGSESKSAKQLEVSR